MYIKEFDIKMEHGEVQFIEEAKEGLKLWFVYISSFSRFSTATQEDRNLLSKTKLRWS